MIDHLTFLSSGSLVFSVPWKLFLTKKIHDQKYMPQIILQERTAYLASYTFLQETLINIKTCHFHSSINHQEHFFHRRHITSYFRPVNCKVFKNSFFIHLQKQSFADVHQNRCSWKFWKLYKKALVLESFFLRTKNKKTAMLKAFNFKKRLQRRCFPVRFLKFLKTPFFIEHVWWLLLHLQ